MFNSMGTSYKFKFIMASKDYDLNVLCVSFISEQHAGKLLKNNLVVSEQIFIVSLIELKRVFD